MTSALANALVKKPMFRSVLLLSTQSATIRKRISWPADRLTMSLQSQRPVPSRAPSNLDLTSAPSTHVLALKWRKLVVQYSPPPVTMKLTPCTPVPQTKLFLSRKQLVRPEMSVSSLLRVRFALCQSVSARMISLTAARHSQPPATFRTTPFTSVLRDLFQLWSRIVVLEFAPPMWLLELRRLRPWPRTSVSTNARAKRLTFPSVLPCLTRAAAMETSHSWTVVMQEMCQMSWKSAPCPAPNSPVQMSAHLIPVPVQRLVMLAEALYHPTADTRRTQSTHAPQSRHCL
ncbi:hypothetical protein BKA57DRAFT_466495 [Linnemannia elongata]|nr:hypothetical protein BKA57DRAFT_466495 [Linnemannia elongata]